MMRNEYDHVCDRTHRSYARDQTRDDSPEQRHSIPHVLQHTICATRKQRLVPTRRMRGLDNRRVASGVEKSHDGIRKKREHQLVVTQPTNTEDDANLFHDMSNRNTTLRPRARLQSSQGAYSSLPAKVRSRSTKASSKQD